MKEKLISDIESLEERAFRLMERAAAEKTHWHVEQLNALIQLLRRDAVELNTILQRLMATRLRLDEIEFRNARLVSFVIKVTAGMIRQKTLSLTPAIRKGVISGGAAIMIDFGGEAGCVVSRVLTGNNTLRARGAVGRFYHEQGIKPGERIHLIQTRHDCWTVRKDEYSTMATSIPNHIS
ncbi:MAG: hypothetical protein KF897_13435 [Opitutaceae bacterium]|nr:hypothetical protein [Opitutaceae bacterium]